MTVRPMIALASLVLVAGPANAMEFWWIARPGEPEFARMIGPDAG